MPFSVRKKIDHNKCPSSEKSAEKCIFRAEKGIFSKSSFYTKMFSDQKYSFSVGQKYFFVISKKVNIFHRIQPIYIMLGRQKLYS